MQCSSIHRFERCSLVGADLPVAAPHEPVRVVRAGAGAGARARCGAALFVNGGRLRRWLPVARPPPRPPFHVPPVHVPVGADHEQLGAVEARARGADEGHVPVGRPVLHPLPPVLRAEVVLHQAPVLGHHEQGAGQGQRRWSHGRPCGAREDQVRRLVVPVPELRDPVVLVEAAVAAYHEDYVSPEDLLVHYESNLGVRRAVAVLPLEFPQRNLHMIARTLSIGASYTQVQFVCLHC